MNRELSQHHMLWERNKYKTPLEKRVRGLFIIATYNPNHRLLHLTMQPPDLPDTETLTEMKDMQNLYTIIEKLDHPIAEHLEKQLSILALPPEIAIYRLDRSGHIL